jgi:hypothetical protein
VGRAYLRFAAGHNLGCEKPVNADFLPAFLVLAKYFGAFGAGFPNSTSNFAAKKREMLLM